MRRLERIKLTIFIFGSVLAAVGISLLWAWPAGLVAAGVIMIGFVIGNEK